MGRLTDIAKGLTGGLVDTLRAVRDALPDIAQAAENDAARIAVAEGIDPEAPDRGSVKKEIALLLIGELIGPRWMRLAGGLIGILIDIGVGRLKREGKIRKPTAEELADVSDVAQAS